MDSRRGGDDEGSAAIQSLKKSEVDVVVALVVLFLAAVPVTDVRLGEMRYVRPQLDCAVAGRIGRGLEPAQVDGTATGTAWDVPLATLSGEVGRAPVWWAAVHVVSKAVGGGGQAPRCRAPATWCGSRCRSAATRWKIRCCCASSPSSPPTATARRSRACIAPSAAAGHLMAYVGSAYFLDTAGFYDVLYSRRDRPAFARDPARDAGLEGAHPDVPGVVARRLRTGSARGSLPRSSPRPATSSSTTRGRCLRAQHPGESTAELEDRLLRRFLAHRSGQRIGVLLGELRARGRGELPHGRGLVPERGGRPGARDRGRHRRRALDGRRGGGDGGAGAGEPRRRGRGARRACPSSSPCCSWCSSRCCRS